MLDHLKKIYKKKEGAAQEHHSPDPVPSSWPNARTHGRIHESVCRARSWAPPRHLHCRHPPSANSPVSCRRALRPHKPSSLSRRTSRPDLPRVLGTRPTNSCTPWPSISLVNPQAPSLRHHGLETREHYTSSSAPCEDDTTTRHNTANQSRSSSLVGESQPYSLSRSRSTSSLEPLVSKALASSRTPLQLASSNPILPEMQICSAMTIKQKNRAPPSSANFPSDTLSPIPLLETCDPGLQLRLRPRSAHALTTQPPSQVDHLLHKPPPPPPSSISGKQPPTP